MIWMKVFSRILYERPVRKSTLMKNVSTFFRLTSEKLPTVENYGD